MNHVTTDKTISSLLGELELDFAHSKSELVQAVAQGDNLEIKIACYHYSEQYDRLACMRRIMRGGYRRMILRLLCFAYGDGACSNSTLEAIADFDWLITKSDIKPKSGYSLIWLLCGLRIWGRVA